MGLIKFKVLKQEGLKMKTIIILSVSLFIILISYSIANSKDYSSAKPLHCSVANVNECTAYSGCELVDPVEANIPYFLEVNLAKKTIRGSTTVSRARKTPIERIETIGDLITLSGAEPQSKGDKYKFGWTMTISTESGQMTLSANTNSAYVRN